MKKEITLYTWPYCPYSNGAKKLLDERGLEYTNVNIFDDEKLRKQLEEKTHHYSVPFVFIGDQCIGGYNELNQLCRTGELYELLEKKKKV